MGNHNESTKTSWILERYAFLEQLQQSPFGNFSVFRKKQENYDYLMVMSRSVKKQFVKEITKQLHFLTSHRNNSPFLKVYDSFIGQKYLHASHSNKQNCKQSQLQTFHATSLCSRSTQHQQVLNVCMEYLNYRLSEYIGFKKKAGQQISVPEYVYIIKQAILSVKLHEEWRFGYLQFDLIPQNCFLTPDGEIRILPFRSNFLKDTDPGCGCISSHSWCGQNNNVGQQKSLHTQTVVNLKNKSGKHLRQIKNLSLELFSTINVKLDNETRKKLIEENNFILNSNDFDFIKHLQSQLNKAKCTDQMMKALSGVIQDFVTIGVEPESQKQSIILKVDTSSNRVKTLMQKMELLQNLQQKKQSQMNLSRNIFSSPSSYSEQDQIQHRTAYIKTPLIHPQYSSSHTHNHNHKKYQILQVKTKLRY